MKTFIRLLMVVTLGLMTSSLCLADAIRMPQGWRSPRKSESRDEWRKKDVHKYLMVKADFNGDGILDQARLLIRDKPPGFGLFAFVSQRDGTFATYVLDEKQDTVYLKSLGISKVMRGRYRTVCGKGIMDCREGEPEEVQLRFEAIEYFKVESASMFFYWDPAIRDFKKAWITD